MGALTFDDIPQADQSSALSFDDVPISVDASSPMAQQDPNRLQSFLETAQKAKQGRYGSPFGSIAQGRLGVSALGESAGAIQDVIGQGIAAAGSGLNQLSGGRFGEAIGDAASFVGSTPLPFTEKDLGQVATEGIQATGQAYGRFKDYMPETAEILEDTFNISTVLPSFAAYGDDVAKGAAKTYQAGKRPPVLPSSIVKKEASALYKKADDIGGSLKPDFTQKYAKNLIRKSEKDELVTKIRRAGGQDDAYANVIEILSEYADEPLTFDRAKSLDEALGQLAYKNIDNMGNVDDVGRQYMDMQSTLREMVDGAELNDFIGGSEAFETAKQARKYWLTQNKLRDVERIIENAERMDNPATGIKSGFRTLLRNAKKTKGYSQKEIKAMEKAARTGLVTDFFRLGGSGLGPIIVGSVGGTAAGPAGLAAAVPAYALQSTSKGIATARQMGRAKNVGRTISQGLSNAPRSSVFVEGAKTLAPALGVSLPPGLAGLTKDQFSYIMSLPPADAQAILEELQ